MSCLSPLVVVVVGDSIGRLRSGSCAENRIVRSRVSSGGREGPGGASDIVSSVMLLEALIDCHAACGESRGRCGGGYQVRKAANLSSTTQSFVAQQFYRTSAWVKRIPRGLGMRRTEICKGYLKIHSEAQGSSGICTEAP